MTPNASESNENLTQTGLTAQNSNRALAIQPITIHMPSLPSPQEVESLSQICKIAAYSGFVNSSSNNLTVRAADAFFVAMFGREIGVPVMSALKGINVIEGKLCCSGQLLLSLMRRAGVEVEIPDPATLTDSATIRVKRPGGSWKEYSYSMAMAEKAGLAGKNTWKKYPAELMIWRSVGIANRFETPDITGGLHTIEEIKPDWEVDADGELIGSLPATTKVSTAPQPEPEIAAGEVVDVDAFKAAMELLHKRAVAGEELTVGKITEALAPSSNMIGDETAPPAVSWATEHFQTFKAACQKITSGWDETIPALVKDKGISDINDPVQWGKAFATGRDAALFIEQAFKKPAAPKSKSAEKAADVSQPAVDEPVKHAGRAWTDALYEEFTTYLFDNFQRLEMEFLNLMDKADFRTDFVTLEDAWNVSINAAIKVGWEMYAESAVYNGKFIEFKTARAIRAYGRSTTFKTLVGDEYYNEWGIGDWKARSEPYEIGPLKITYEVKTTEGKGKDKTVYLDATDCKPVTNPFEDDAQLGGDLLEEFFGAKEAALPTP